jgi:hypothetical protein
MATPMFTYEALSKEELIVECKNKQAVIEWHCKNADWLEDELMECMRIVAPGMGCAMPDEITYAIMVTAIRRLMEADTDKYEALLERWQARHASEPQNGASRG